jgi:hypothetical protein
VKNVRLLMEDFQDAPKEIQGTLEKLFALLNPFMLDTTTALDRNLTPVGNLVSDFRQVTVQAPAQKWTAPTLLNSWVNFGGGWVEAGYRIDSFGRVHLRGLVKDGTVSAVGVIFTLPVGYRPAQAQIFAVDGNSAYGRLTIQEDGDVIAEVGSNVHFSLNGVSFDAASPAAPESFVGSGWPITLNPAFKDRAPVRFCLLTNAEDQTAGAPNTTAYLQPSWFVDAKGNVVIKRIDGLTPERAYRLSFLLLG